jgi:hypothetical protein
MVFVSENLNFEELQEALQLSASSNGETHASQHIKAKTALSFCVLTHESLHTLLSKGTKGISTAKTPAKKVGKSKGDTAPNNFANPEVLTLFGNLESSLKQQNQAVSEAAISASAPQSAKGSPQPQSTKGASSLGSSGGVSFPQPNVPFPANNPPCPLDPSVPAGENSWSNNGGYLGKLNAFIQWICNHPADLQAKMNFTQYLFNLQAAGDMQPGSDVMNVLNQSPEILNSLMPQMIDQFTEWTFFNGGGPGGAQTYLNQILSAVSAADPSGNNPYLQALSNRASQWLNNYLPTFTAEHYDANSNAYYWTITAQNGATYTYNFNNPNFGDDSDVIDSLIENYSYQDSTGNPNPFEMQFNQNGGGLNSFIRNYRLSALEALLKKYKNPEIAISLWMMQAYDQQFQGTEGGLADTTNVLTSMTNNYATPLLSMLGSLGQWSTSDAAKFINMFMNGTTLINGQQQTSSGLSGPWNNNVFNAIWNTPLPASAGPYTTVGQALQDYSEGKLDLGTITGYFNTINYQDPTNPTPNVGYQAMISALQSGGALLTGTSKTISTELSTVANLDNEVIKYGHSVVDPNGGGLVQLMNKIIDSQISH